MGLQYPNMPRMATATPLIGVAREGVGIVCLGYAETMSDEREARVTATFVELADTLVAGFDIPDFLHSLTERCIELLDVSAAGLLLADTEGRLQLISAYE